METAARVETSASKYLLPKLEVRQSVMAKPHIDKTIDIHSLSPEIASAVDFWTAIYKKPLPVFRRCPESCTDKAPRGTIIVASWTAEKSLPGSERAIILYPEFFVHYQVDIKIQRLYHELAHYRFNHLLDSRSLVGRLLGPLVEWAQERQAEMDAKRTFHRYIDFLRR